MTTPTPAEMLTANPEPKRDRWGRYLLPHPETGKEQAWTRVTTFAKSISDTFALTQWELRMATVGLSRRPDLIAQAATVTDPDDPDAKKLLNGLASDAKECAGSSVRRNLGTALHSFTEQVDRGQDPTIPEQYRSDVDAYVAAMKTAGMEILPRYIERIVVIPELGLAGTFDRLVHPEHDDLVMVADLKTGRDLSYSWAEIAVQLACYAHATHIYDPTTGGYESLTDEHALLINTGEALVMHVPVGEKRCDLYKVDIHAGWKAAQLCTDVREWRKRKDLAVPFSTFAVPAPPSSPADSVTDDTAARKAAVILAIEQIKALPKMHPERRAMAEVWPKGVKPSPPWTNDELDLIELALKGETPFTGPAPELRTVEHYDPPARAPEPWPIDEGEGTFQADDLRRSIANLTDTQRDAANRWAQQGEQQQRPWASSHEMTERRFVISSAVIGCLASGFHDPDETEPDHMMRAALSVAIGEDVQPSWLTGAVIGSLTIDQAACLFNLAAHFGTVRKVSDAIAHAAIRLQPAT